MTTEDAPEKRFGVLDTLRERTGIYGLGFDPASIKGLAIPVIFAALGILGAIAIYLFL